MMAKPQFPYTRYQFDEEDFTLLKCLLTFIKGTAPKIGSLARPDDETRILLDSIWLDPSLQGWTKKELQEGEAKIGDEIYPDDVLDPARPDARPWDDNKSKGKGVVFLGLYFANPRRIVLFPNAIKAVAGRQEFLDASGGCIRRASDTLTRKVLVHELGHWFTLDPDSRKQAARLALPKPGYGAGNPARLGNEGEYCNFHETAESLANLCSWFAFQHLASTDEKSARELMRTMFLTYNSAASYEYQLYWFWLVFGGIADCPRKLDGGAFLDLNLESLSCRIERLSAWAAGDSAEPDALPRQLVMDKFDPGILKTNCLPGFTAPLEGYLQAANGLWCRRYMDYEKWKHALGDSGLGGLLDL